MPIGLKEGTAADALQDVVEVGTEGTDTVEPCNDVNGYIAMVVHLYRRGGEGRGWDGRGWDGRWWEGRWWEGRGEQETGWEG